jgi:hypothetical protein
MGLINFPHTVGTSVTTVILFCGVSINDQSLALLQVKAASSQVQVSHGVSFDRYTLVDNSYSQEKKNIETIHEFSSNLLENIEDIPLEFSEAIDENFWDLV